MRRLLLLLLSLVILPFNVFALTWTHYTNMTKTVAGVPQSISTGAVDAVFMNDYIWVCGTGNTFNGSSDRSLYAVPRSLSGETIDRSDRLPYPGQKYTRMFGYGNRLYWFGGAQHRINGARRFPFLYSAVVSGSSIGAFSKIGDLPYYLTRPYIQYSIAQDEDNNAYYIIGGQVWGNQFNCEDLRIAWGNGKLYYQFAGSDRNETPYGPGVTAYDMIHYGALDSDGDFIDYARAQIAPTTGLLGIEGAFSPVSDGLIFIQTRGYTTVTTNQGYIIWKVDALGNTISQVEYASDLGKFSQINGAVTYNNDVYFCGYHNSKAVVGKVNSGGAQQWIVELGNPGFNGLSEVTANNGYLYAVGQIGASTPYICKLDVDGNVLTSTAYTYAGATDALYTGITTTATDIYVTLRTAGGVPPQTGAVISYDNVLNFNWSYTVPGWIWAYDTAIKDASTINVYGSGALLQIDTSGNCLSAIALPYASFDRVVSDGTNFYGISGVDAEVIKTDSDGNSLWTHVAPFARRDFDSNAFASNNISYIKVSGSVVVDSWSTTVPFRVFDQYSTIYDGYLYVFGGNDREAHSVTDSWSAPINPDGTLGTWSSITPMPAPGGNKGDITRIGDKIFIVSALDPIGLNLEYEGTLSSGTVAWAGPSTSTFPFMQKYTSLVNDGAFVYSVGGWSGFYGENPVDDIYISMIFSPTVTPTATQTSIATSTPTPTITTTFTVTPTLTVTPTVTRTPDQIWYRTSLTIYQGSVLMNAVSGSYVVDISSYWTWFKDGYSVFCNRDIAQDNTYVIVEKDPVLPQFTIHIQDRTTLTDIDLSSNTCTVQFTVIKEP